MSQETVRPEFVRAVKRERQLYQKYETWSVLFTFTTFGFIALSIAGSIIFKQLLDKKIYWLFGLYGFIVLGEIISTIGYVRALRQHRRVAEDLDVLCQPASAPSPRD